MAETIVLVMHCLASQTPLMPKQLSEAIEQYSALDKVMKCTESPASKLKTVKLKTK